MKFPQNRKKLSTLALIPGSVNNAKGVAYDTLNRCESFRNDDN